MRRFMSTSAGLILLAAATSARADGTPLSIDLWPATPPGETRPVGPERMLPSKPEERCQKKVTDVGRPTLTVYRPAAGKANGAAVVVAPGGGYHIVAMDLEGEEVAAWLNSIGVTAVVLKYRVPRRPGTPGDQPPVTALMDAQRALSVVRHRAAEWGVDTHRIGMLGFSAGGHLTAWTTTNADRRAYEPVDATDRASCRPDFFVLIYPAYLQKKGERNVLNEEIRVTKDAPPCFLVHAADDPLTSENSAVMYLALRRLDVPAELHIYNSGGHGFGLRPDGTPCSTWPARCAEWLRDRGLLKGNR